MGRGRNALQQLQQILSKLWNLIIKIPGDTCFPLMSSPFQGWRPAMTILYIITVSLLCLLSSVCKASLQRIMQ